MFVIQDFIASALATIFHASSLKKFRTSEACARISCRACCRHLFSAATPLHAFSTFLSSRTPLSLHHLSCSPAPLALSSSANGFQRHSARSHRAVHYPIGEKSSSYYDGAQLDQDFIGSFADEANVERDSKKIQNASARKHEKAVVQPSAFEQQPQSIAISK